MASSSFYFAVGGRFAMPTYTPAKVSSFGYSAGPLFQMEPYGSGGFTRARITDKTWLPPINVPMVDLATGKCTDPWYRFLNFFMNQRMGGINGPSMAEVQTNVVETKAAAVNAAVTASAVESLAVTNAEALKAQVEVSRVNDLAGADQIPEVILRAPNKTYLDSYL